MVSSLWSLWGSARWGGLLDSWVPCGYLLSSHRLALLHAYMHVQAGKTLMLDTVLPAVVRGHPVFGVNGKRELRIISLSLASLPLNRVSSSSC
jgi:hypothetical protein